MTQLTWQGSQGFRSQARAIEAAGETAANVDPRRPMLRWLIADIMPIPSVSAETVWIGTHYCYRVDGRDVHSTPVTA